MKVVSVHASHPSASGHRGLASLPRLRAFCVVMARSASRPSRPSTASVGRRLAGSFLLVALALACSLAPPSLSPPSRSPTSFLPNASFAACMAPPPPNQIGDIKRVVLRLEAKDGKVYDLNVGGLQAVAGGAPQLGVTPGVGVSGSGAARPVDRSAQERRPSMWSRVSQHAANTLVASVLFLSIGEAYSWLKRHSQEKQKRLAREEVAREKAAIESRLREVEERLTVLEDVEEAAERGEGQLTGKQKADLSILRSEREDLLAQQRRNALRDGQLNGFPVKKTSFASLLDGRSRSRVRRGSKESRRQNSGSQSDEEDVEESDEDARALRADDRDGRSAPGAAKNFLDRRQIERSGAKKGDEGSEETQKALAGDSEEKASKKTGETKTAEAGDAGNAGNAGNAGEVGRPRSQTRERKSQRKDAKERSHASEDEDDFALLRSGGSSGSEKMKYITQLLAEHPGMSPEEAIEMLNFMSNGKRGS
ncbi:hypothetical protein TGMAS_254000 [Toxoplasma gondii MAS]|uniref:Uncharacterized protein n=2 Tax=Toxoplasma gondii TaxID=5811 RepID=A0A086QQV9_TOXGO|nr:hypothetical protein TGMAS_254000 [Toxoplasma gondii MAS]PUA89044.1 hypothetical protein TGBR9_254000 [Toxoplasma gondii TgCATBr9]